MKKVMIGVLSLAVIVIGGLFFVWSNLDGIVKDTIETYGSKATRTQVAVAKVILKIESGDVSIQGLTVGNPSGFSDPNVFELGEISVKLDVSTVNENPIVIDSVVIKAPKVTYEINAAGTSNVDVLKKNLAQGASKSSSKQQDSDDGEAVKMIIRKLVIERSKAVVRIAALGGKEKTVALARIQLNDVGKKSGGATAAEVAQILSSKLLANVKGSVMKLGVQQYIGKSADAFKQKALDQVGGQADPSKAVGAALQGFLGKH